MKTKSTQTKNTNMSFPNDSIVNPSNGNNIIDHSITIVMIVCAILIFSTLQLAAQEAIKKDKKNINTQDIKNPNEPKAPAPTTEFKNGSGNAIITITDEGADVGSMTLPSGSAPSTPTNKLYNEGGTLKFNGSDIGTGTNSGWTDAGASVHTTTGADRVGIGITDPNAELEVAG